jgi:DNA-binding XRE family transcriptional regulator
MLISILVYPEPLMASRRLPNHLLKYRKRSALSQAEVAYLLGAKGGAKVCRYEKFLRQPNLETVLAYLVIFRCHVAEVFPGLMEKAQTVVRARAKRLAKKEPLGSSKNLTMRKREAILLIAGCNEKI